MEQFFYNRSEFKAAMERARQNGTYASHSERRVMTRGRNTKAPRYSFTLRTT